MSGVAAQPQQAKNGEYRQPEYRPRRFDSRRNKQKGSRRRRKDNAPRADCPRMALGQQYQGNLKERYRGPPSAEVCFDDDLARERYSFCPIPARGGADERVYWF
jgi:hypothetical protein